MLTNSLYTFFSKRPVEIRGVLLLKLPVIYSKLLRESWRSEVFSIKNSKLYKKDDVEKLNEFQLKIDNLRLKIHAKYIAFISLGIVVWMVATGTANNSEFSDWLSFASTLTSIILSVIAIFMSISGESKTEGIRNQMEETAYRLDNAVDDVSNANEEIKSSIIELQKKIDSMSEKVDNFSKQNSNENIADNSLKKDIKFK